MIIASWVYQTSENYELGFYYEFGEEKEWKIEVMCGL